ncbi:hypothetical protein D6117_002253 [Lactococcus lactis]|uniref:hypothetical protein n=1 Tax=Lactococcus TaxID=1357 RepID=UPI000F535970|nr:MULTISPECIES: hypothetical protein [Lactococcus]MCT0506186.1 hypothetical protein [Lactococcus cremoris]RQE00530.1 hypothetical protein D6109_06570 [Lactococcus lactis]RQE04547.1 hypothetical protein D6107_04135 [Lactococcus lactis]RQE07358.1 hypothetical protein D6110_06260 [Lactococcus lactis]RQE11104.1 hypothetical protein D6108_03495 [Lactococcus lactis]
MPKETKQKLAISATVKTTEEAKKLLDDLEVLKNEYKLNISLSVGTLTIYSENMKF